MRASHVVVDGSNIATEGRSTPSLAQLDEAVRAFLAERPHDTCIVVVDATFEHRIDPSEKKMYDDALSANELLTPPAGSIGRGDKFILEIADRVGATVFSNDSFQEFHGEYEWLFDEGRLVGGKPVPGVGWVFIERTPVRGPRSRMATRASTRKRARAASGSSVKKAQRTGPTSSGTDLGPKPVPKSPPPRKKKAAPSPPPSPAPTAEPQAKKVRRQRGAAKTQTTAAEPANQPLPFIEFVAEHQPGSSVVGEVVQFSSHGAYIDVGNVRCYAPLKLLGKTAPRSAREVLTRGETRKFVVHAIHAARRGIDLALPEAVEIEAPVKRAPAPRKRSSAQRGAPAAHTVAEAPTSAGPVTDQAPGDPGAELRESEATLAPAKKGTARKAASKKKAAPRKAAARKTAAKKTTARKSTARKTTARKGVAKKRPAKKKAAAKKGTARKSAAKKTTAKRSTAKKATKKKAPARKTTARKKSAAKKSPAKRKATAKKAPARKRTAKKTTARKATARKKSPAKRASARKR